MEIQIKAYAYTIDIITEIRYFCKCNNAVFGKFRIIFTCAISKTDCSLHHNFHALFKISGNEKFVRTAVLTPHPSRNLRKSTPRPRPAPLHQPSQKLHYPLLCIITLAFRNANICMCLFRIRTIPLAFRRGVSLLLPLHRILPPSQPLQKDNNPSPRTTTLASLVKGEVLSPEKIRATTGGIASSPSLACTNPLEPTLSLALHQHPCLPCQR